MNLFLRQPLARISVFKFQSKPYTEPRRQYSCWFQRQYGLQWKTARRVVAKVEHHLGELFPRVGFIVTNSPESGGGAVL